MIAGTWVSDQSRHEPFGKALGASEAIARGRVVAGGAGRLRPRIARVRVADRANTG